MEETTSVNAVNDDLSKVHKVVEIMKIISYKYFWQNSDIVRMSDSSG